MTATILSAAGYPDHGSTQTPFAIAPYMGENAFITFTVVRFLVTHGRRTRRHFYREFFYDIDDAGIRAFWRKLSSRLNTALPWE
jgi:hypothetical protein